MEKIKLTASYAKVGMNKDTHPSLLQETDYTHAKNANVENESGGLYNLTTEHSNILATKFKEGFKVIHANNDLNSNDTYFFLVNPSTNVGEFGVIRNTQNIQDLSDVEVQCDDCDYKNKLSEPLESQVQVASQTYITLLSDACKEDKTEGFNFNINNPIHFSVIKDEKLGKTIYFSQVGNPPRYINIDRIEDYFIQEVSCNDDITLDCPDFTKMLVQKPFTIPSIEAQSIEIGGNLKKGNYEFFIALSDAVGNQITEYYSERPPIHIFDPNDLVVNELDTRGNELFTETNFAIRLNVSNLDKKYTHYKVAVLSNTDAGRWFIVGNYPVATESILFSTTDRLLETSAQEVNRGYIYLEQAEGVVTANNYLYQFGIKEREPINLQPVVNLMGEFLQWQTHVANEGLYADGVSASKYKTYNREEVVPVGIRFLLEGGVVTPNFPFIGRQAQETDLEEIDNEDSESVNSNTTSCNPPTRNKRWQLYDTATIDEGFCDSELQTIEVEQTLVRNCFIENVDSVGAGSISITPQTIFTTFQDYINDNLDNCSQILPTEICEVINGDYSESICENLFDDLDCSNQTLVEGSLVISVGNVSGETITRVPKVFPTEYTKIFPPNNCSIYQVSLEGGFERDTDLEALLIGDTIYKRNESFFNEDCDYVQEVDVILNTSTPPISSNYFGYDYNSDIDNLLTTKVSTVSGTGFNTFMHKKALWFKTVALENDFIIEVTKQKDASGNDSFDTLAQTLRLNIFKSCSETNAIFSTFINIDLGKQFQLTRSGSDLIIKDNNTTPITIVGGWNSEFYFAIETKIISKSSLFIIAPTKGCFNISKRATEDKRIDITWTGITFNKSANYSTSCLFDQPLPPACEAVPYQKGNFGFIESKEIYPDNKELFDSTFLEITPNDFSNLQLKEKFEEAFVSGLEGGKYVWKEEGNKEVVDFTCRKIRHFKMPSNKTAPYTITAPVPSMTDSLIFPLGFTIDEQVIVDFLNIAEKNNLITKKQRQSITGYEIVRGDLVKNRSIIASGLLYDMRKYEDTDAKRTIHYSNYPYNSYRNDIFNLDNSGNPITHSGWGDENNRYTFHSPQTDFFSPTLPTELSIQGYLQGQAKINFEDVKEHPKWVMLSGRAKDLAGVLAGLEVALEITINSSLALSNAQVWGFGGPAGAGASIGVPGFVAAAAIAVLGLVEGAARWGRYRYEWLNTFRDIGTPHNFAYYQYGEGKFSYLNLAQEEENQLRGINSAKYLKDGMYMTNNPVTGEQTQINNLRRERTVFLDLGQHSIKYPSTYKNFDRESLTFLGENGLKQVGTSSDIFKNIASPYVYLKNYLSNQHGSIESVQWVSTGYRGDLTNPQSTCLSIFGGDTFITRHYVKRKMAQFLETSMGLADKTPFNYKEYNNIGKNPKFFVSYNINTEVERDFQVFPDIDDDQNMDNFESSSMYRIPPSKFYLSHYGISSFLCESRVNTDLRYAKTEPEQNFYPNVDLSTYTQEVNVPIKQHERFYYNSGYSKEIEVRRTLMLPSTYSREVELKRANKPNGIYASLPDNSENSITDPWLVYRPLDFFEFPTQYGKLKSISQLEDEALLARFENTNVIYNKVDYTNDDGNSQRTVFLGGASTFQRRTASFANAEIGFGGTQNSTSLSCEAGHFHVDAKRGQVIQVFGGGKQSEEISSTIQGKPSGMRNWFKQQLPFKIQKHFPNVDVDNNYNGVGISMGWDSRFRRVFITKKDYIPIVDCIEFDNGVFYYNQTECEGLSTTPTCPDGFTYNPLTEKCERGFGGLNDTELVFVMDNSNSVSPTEITQLNNFVNSIVEELEPNIVNGKIRVSIVKFASIAENRQSLTSDMSLITDAIYSTRLTNTTNIIQGLCLAKAELDANARPLSDKRIILIADGVHNAFSSSCGVSNDSQGVLDLGQMIKADGIDITLVAIGVEGEIISVLNEYGGVDEDSEFSNYPLSTEGSGVNGFSSYSTSFNTSQDIIDEVLEDLFQIEQVDPIQIDSRIGISLTDPTYFKDVSWTVAYAPFSGSWLSFYDFKPNYYINHQNYFQTGLNSNDSTFGLWSHLLTNKSFLVFYGRKHDFDLEYVSKSEGMTKKFNNVEMWTEAKRYHNEYDFAFSPEITFNQTTIYNNVVCSGLLNLVPQRNNIVFNRNYPKTNTNNTQDILVTNKDNNKWAFDYVFNRVNNNVSNQPTLFFDDNQIEKTVNNKIVSFKGKRVLDRLEGDWFLVRLRYNKDSRYQLTFKFALNELNV